MNIATSPHAFCGTTLASPAALCTPQTVLATPGDILLLSLCRQHIALDPVIDDLWTIHVAAYDRTVAVLGDCPKHGDANRAWLRAYQGTEADTTQTAYDEASDRQCKLMEKIVRINAVTVAGIAAKLDLWRRTDERFIGGNDDLWNSIADDLEALCGVRIAEAVES